MRAKKRLGEKADDLLAVDLNVEGGAARIVGAMVEPKAIGERLVGRQRPPEGSAVGIDAPVGTNRSRGARRGRHEAARIAGIEAPEARRLRSDDRLRRREALGDEATEDFPRRGARAVGRAVGESRRPLETGDRHGVAPAGGEARDEFDQDVVRIPPNPIVATEKGIEAFKAAKENDRASLVGEGFRRGLANRRDGMVERLDDGAEALRVRATSRQGHDGSRKHRGVVVGARFAKNGQRLALLCRGFRRRGAAAASLAAARRQENDRRDERECDPMHRRRSYQKGATSGSRLSGPGPRRYGSGAMSDSADISESDFIDRVLTVIEPLEIDRPELLARHAWLVREKNKVMNLTRIVEPEAMAVKHIMDSLAALPILKGTDEVSFKKVVDLGTGAGWPGLALAIAIPGLEVILVDSTKKKIDFLNEVVARLGLSCQVTCVWRRFEEFIRDERHDTDLVMARAVGPVKDILEWCTGRWFGHLLLWKGPRADEELREAGPLMNHRRISVALDESYELPGDEFVRRLIMLA